MLKKKNICKDDHHVRILHGGAEYFDQLGNLIRNSKKNIHIQYYIFDDDTTGNFILDLLIEAVSKGVHVYMVLDGYASQPLSKTKATWLRQKGIKVHFFNPLFKSKYFYFGRRLHHKIFISDQKTAIIGGLNISDKYNDILGHLAWLDYAVKVEGPIVLDLCVLCWKTINNFPRNLKKTECELNPTDFSKSLKGMSRVCMHRNDWVRRKVEIFSLYHTLIREAKEEIILISSYFLPGHSLRKLLSKAAARGVKVKIIVGNKSDIKISKNAEKWLYDWLLRNNIELYELNNRILHAKIGICDKNWFTIGSYNINDISAYASIELNLSIQDQNVTQSIKQELNFLIQTSCTQIDPLTFPKLRKRSEQFYQWLNYHLVRLILFVFTFYYTQKKH